MTDAIRSRSTQSPTPIGPSKLEYPEPEMMSVAGLVD
jgi:hypothetical protein